MPVTKTMRECYEVREARPHGEWANITLACWDRPVNKGTPHERIYYCGEIAIHSSFGTWGHIWTACAEPFKEFLQDIEFDYVFGKFLGSKAEEFDGEGSVLNLRSQILERRRMSEFGKDEARALWNEIDLCKHRLTCSLNEWVEALRDVADNLEREGHRESPRWLAEPWERAVDRPVPATVAFWRKLWPLFVEALRAETAEQSHAEPGIDAALAGEDGDGASRPARERLG